jgi:hypothetical protein
MTRVPPDAAPLDHLERFRRAFDRRRMVVTRAGCGRLGIDAPVVASRRPAAS